MSEANDEAGTSLLSLRLANVVNDPISHGPIFTHSRPPSTYLFSVPFRWILPLNEFTLRLPYALFVIFQLPLVFKTSEMLFGRRVGVVAMAIFACSGMLAINRLLFGISVYVFMELLALFWLVRYVHLGEKNDIL